MTERVWCLLTVVSFHPKAGIIIPVSGLNQVGVLREMAAHRGHIVAIVADYAIYVTVHERGF